jgi:hypothetical protein
VTQYNRLSDNSLQNIAGNHYGVYWMFTDPANDVYAVYGQADYANLAAAQASTVPSSLCPECVSWARLIGRIIFKQNTTTFTQVDSAFQQTFVMSNVQNHDDLGGIDGGAAGEYYHTTANQHSTEVQMILNGTMAETIAAGQAVYQSTTDGQWRKAKAVAGWTNNLSVCTIGGSATGTGYFIRSGKITSLTGLPSSSSVWLDQSSAGSVTGTQPTSGFVIPIGITESTTTLDVSIGLTGYTAYNVTATQELLTINSAGQTAFTLSQTPQSSASVKIYLNGQLCYNNVNGDYVLSGTSLTWQGITLATSDRLIAVYNSESTLGVQDATTVNKGIASFNSTDFSVTSGAVSINTARTMKVEKIFALEGLGAIETNFGSLYLHSGTNFKMYSRAFDDTTQEYSSGKFKVPSNIGTGTVTFYAYIAPATGAASKNVKLSFECLHIGDNAAWDAAMTAYDSGDISITATTGNITVASWTSSIATLGWAANDIVYFRISRKAPVGTNLTGDMYWQYFAIVMPVTLS